MTSSVIYYSTDARKNEIYFLNFLLCRMKDSLTKMKAKKIIESLITIGQDFEKCRQWASSLAVYVLKSQIQKTSIITSSMKFINSV